MISPTSRRYLIMSLSLTCFASVALAGGQGAARKDSTASPALKARPWSLQSHASSLDGPMNLMIQRRFSPKVSLRLDINVKGNVTASNQQRSDLLVDDNTSGSYGISGDIHYIRHLTRGSDFRWYIGAGPRVGYTANELQREHIWEHTYPDSATFEYKSESSSEGPSWTAGMLAFAGIEWFISGRISLAIEYGLSGQYQWSRNIWDYQSTTTNLDTGDVVEEDTRRSERVSGTWSASSGSAKWVLAIHF